MLYCFLLAQFAFSGPCLCPNRAVDPECRLPRHILACSCAQRIAEHIIFLDGCGKILKPVDDISADADPIRVLFGEREPVVIEYPFGTDELIKYYPGDINTDIGVVFEDPLHDLVVQGSVHPARDAAVGPDKLYLGMPVERLLHLMEPFWVALRAYGGYVLVYADGKLILNAEIEDAVHCRMIAACGVAVGEIGELIMPEEYLPDPVPDAREIPDDAFDVLVCVLVAGVKSTDHGEEPGLLRRIEGTEFHGHECINGAVVIALRIIGEVIFRRVPLPAFPPLRDRETEDTRVGYVSLIHVVKAMDQSLGILQKVHDMEMAINTAVLRAEHPPEGTHQDTPPPSSWS